MSPALVRRLRALLARRGLQLSRRPPTLLGRPEAELRLSLDHVIAHHLLVHRPEGFSFVQVGAFDGLANDPIHDLVVRLGWRGVLLEPQRDAFDALVATYAGRPGLVLRNAAVAAESGRRPLYRIRSAPGLPDWAPQVASFRREVVLAHRDVIPNVEALIEVEEVECVGFDEILEPLGGGTLDLLQIDAEGEDFEIVKLFHAGGRRAHIVHFEHKHLSAGDRDACCRLLIELGYQVALEGTDAIAYRRG